MCCARQRKRARQRPCAPCKSRVQTSSMRTSTNVARAPNAPRARPTWRTNCAPRLISTIAPASMPMPPILPALPRQTSHRVARLVAHHPHLLARHHQHRRLPSWTGEPKRLAAHLPSVTHRMPCLSTRWLIKICRCTHNRLVAPKIRVFTADSVRPSRLLSDLAPNGRLTPAAPTFST